MTFQNSLVFSDEWLSDEPCILVIIDMHLSCVSNHEELFTMIESARSTKVGSDGRSVQSSFCRCIHMWDSFLKLFFFVNILYILLRSYAIAIVDYKRSE